jgi:serine/threonine protein kinase
VLYSIVDQMWKVADFGLTSEATSTAFRFTDVAHGTPGYRSPELLKDDGAKYNNKVDIWAMGCLFFELATGSKLFSDDVSVIEYARSEGILALEISCDGTLDTETIEYVKGMVHDMLQIEPTSRPSASELRARFHKYYKLAGQRETPGQIQSSQYQREIHGALSEDSPLAAMGGREHAAFTADPHVITLILWLGPYRNTTSSRVGTTVSSPRPAAILN